MPVPTPPGSKQSADRIARVLDLAVPILLGITIVCFAIHKIVEYDLWWQLKTGEWILANGIPRTDPFSFAYPGRPWVEMRWLYCVAADGLYTHLGVNALIISKTILVVIAFAFLWFADDEAPWWSRSFGIATAVALAHLRFVVRPELVSLVCLAILLTALQRYRRGGRSAWIFALPVLQVLWTNSHTLFVLGPATLWIYAIAELVAGRLPFEWLRANALPWPRIRPLLIVAALTTVATLLNPYFVEGALFPVQLFRQIQSGNAIRELITELKSPFAYAGFTIFFVRYPIVIAVSAIGFLLNRKRVTPGLLAAWGAFLYLSAQSERNVTLFGVVAGLAVIVNYGEAASEARSWIRGENLAWMARAACVLLAIVAIPATVSNAYYRRIDPSRRFGFGIADNRFPIAAMDFADAEKLPSPILANLVDSNYVLFDRGPGSVLIDGRLEVYGGDIVSSAVDLFRTGKGFDELVARSGFQTAAIRYLSDGEMFRQLNRSSAWAPVYADSSHVVFVRDSPSSKDVIGRLRIDWKNPVVRDPDGGDGAAAAAFGNLAILTGNLEMARDRLSVALAAQPDDAGLALQLGVVLRALGDDARATETLARAGGDGTRVATALGAAMAFESANSFEAATATYRGIIARGGGTAQILDRLAKAAAAANDLGTVEDAQLKLTELEPNSPDRWNAVATTATSRMAYDRSIAYFEHSLALSPRQPAVLTAIGVVRVRMGDPVRARESFNQALAIDPNYQPAQRQLKSLGG